MKQAWLLALLTVAGCASAPTTSPSAAPSAADTANVQAAAALPPVVVHQAAPNISFTALDGKTHTLDEFKGKFIVLAFFAQWCGVCQKEMPVLQQFGKDYQDKNTVVVGVESTGAAVDIVQAFQNTITPGMPLYFDTTQNVSKTFLVTHYPTLYTVSPDFTVQENILGAVSADYLAGRYKAYGQQTTKP